MFRSHSKIWYVDLRTNSDFRSRFSDLFPPTRWESSRRCFRFRHRPVLLKSPKGNPIIDMPVNNQKLKRPIKQANLFNKFITTVYICNFLVRAQSIYIIMEEIVSVSENNEIIGLRNFQRLLFGFRLQTPPPVNHPGAATTTTTTEKFEIADICKQWND